jgi:pyrroloquinoline-quinone synthase/pyrroloquinoline quinone biosynthesis protein D
MTELLSPKELAERLRGIGAERYHNKHPFHELMNAGKLTKDQLRAWALNRYYYQAMIPVKDAVVLSRMTDPAMRREWRQRIIDHDGDNDQEGGIARWFALTQGLGLDRTYVSSLQGILPATRFAVEAYVNFVREKTLLEAVASSLTEMFSPTTISVRVSGMLRNYDFITPEILAYFDKRLTQAPRDADFALDYVCREARTPEQQQLALKALTFKCDMLWAMLDALYFAYVTPGWPPPGAFKPEGKP